GRAPGDDGEREAVRPALRRRVRPRIPARPARRRCDPARRCGDRRGDRPQGPPRPARGGGARAGGRRMIPVASTRLPAAERRQAFLEAALRVFSEGSYRGTTTAEIAREAGVSEPILYRHFPSKRDLYLACIEESWR